MNQQPHGMLGAFFAQLGDVVYGEVSDAELLTRYVNDRDDDSFRRIVARHGPMVWTVCSRLLRREDAEDAFQATFIVGAVLGNHPATEQFPQGL